MNNSGLLDYSYTVADRFIRYVQIDTQSDPHADCFPSSVKQKDLSRLLVAELLEMGVEDAHMDEWGYVYATLPSTASKKIPTICFCAHVDTAPDCSGTGVKPILHKNYQGQEIVLPDDPRQIISPLAHPYLAKLKGHDIITASGTTLLGADDKAGVAAIMDFANFIMRNPSLEHGPIRLLFTPDEEVGRGTAKVDLKKLNADFGYTLDGGDAGSLEDETFSADGVRIIFQGVIIHPGYAKGKLVNAMKIAGELLDALPKDALSPETTSGKEGFIHPTGINGMAESCSVDFIIRDFDTAQLSVKEEWLRQLTAKVVSAYPGARFEFIVTEQYRNMKEVLDVNPEVVRYAKEAIGRAGLPLKMESIRGGTDGSRLSFMGLPCPNLFAGEQAIHSKHEFVSVQDMQKAVETMVHLVSIAAEESNHS